MKRYRVYKHSVHGYQAVKQGWSWPALFFPLIWIVWKRMWKVAALWLATCVVVSAMEEVVEYMADHVEDITITWPVIVLGVTAIAGHIGLMIAPAYAGNRWYEDHLVKSGYEFCEQVIASNPNDAIQTANTVCHINRILDKSNQ